jgi:hypothetical protein
MNSYCTYAMNPENVNFYKPPPRGKHTERKKYKLIENVTNSVGDIVFDKTRQERSTNSRIAELKNNLSLIEKSEPVIRMHIVNRITLFFLQLVVCNQVPFHFEMNTALHQGFPTKMLIKKTSNMSVEVPFASAHSSTLPCLIAYPRKEWSLWVQNPWGHRKPNGFVYLQDSNYYNRQNATIGLVKLVNTTDSALDGNNYKANKLRTKSIDLINDAARGLTTPQIALDDYLTIAKMMIENIINTPETKEETRSILGIYLENVNQLIGELTEGVLCDRLLDLKIDNSRDDKDSLRKALYDLRYKIIRISQETESVILKKIAVLSATIQGIGRKPDNYSRVLKAKIFSLTTSDYEKKTMARLFNISEEQLKSDLTGKRKGTAERLLNEQRYEGLFNVLMRDIRKECHSLSREEILFRAAVATRLRYHKGWTQKDLSREYSKDYGRGMSPSTISNIENHRKLIDKKLALRLSKLYDVDPRLFFPALFTSTDEG